MASHHRIAVYGIGQDTPHRYTRRHIALDLVQRGLAAIEGSGIRLLPPKVPVVSSHNSLSDGYQGAVLELAAIDKARKFVNGGLTRNEHRPSKISPFSAAKVGHQL